MRPTRQHPLPPHTLSEFETVKRVATRGVAWTGAESALRQVVQILAQLVLARVLVPNDFGILGMALVFQGVGQLIADFGIGSAIVQRQTLDPLALSSAFWANLAVATLLTLVLVAAAPAIGMFYGTGEVTVVVQVLALSLMLGGLRTLPRALLYKNMEFSTLARIGMASTVAGAVVAVTMAMSGCGLWSLVAQPMVGNATELALVWIAGRWRPQFAFDWASMRDLAHFSYGVLGTNLLNYAVRNTDNLLIGRYLGSGPLGYYALAYQIMLYPLSQVSSVIVKVLFPAMSKLQDDPPQIRAAFLGAVSMIALVTFPMMFGLLAVSHDFIVVVFGEKWLPMQLVLQVFCGIGLLQSIGTTVGTIYLSTGHTRLMLKVTFYATPFVIGSFVVGLPWGIEGVAISYGCVTCVLFVVLVRIALGLIGLRLGTLLDAVRGALLAAIFMLACTLAATQQLTALTSGVRLAMVVALGCVSYTLATLLCNRAQVERLLNLLKANLRSTPRV